MVESPVDVETTGGETLTISFQRQGNGFERVFLEGETRIVYEGQLWEEAYR